MAVTENFAYAGVGGAAGSPAPEAMCAVFLGLRELHSTTATAWGSWWEQQQQQEEEKDDGCAVELVSV